MSDGADNAERIAHLDPKAWSMTPEDASRRERLAKMCEQQAGLCEWWASAWPKRDYPAEAKDWREIATILRAASPAAPGERMVEQIKQLRSEIYDLPLIDIVHRLTAILPQPEPRTEEGERITPSRHQPKPSGIPGGTITSEGERIDPEDARGSRVTPTGVASTADDNAYHRNYTEAAMDERADALCERCHVAVIDKGTVLCETCLAACRIEWNPPGASLTSAAMAERDGGVEETLRWLGVFLDSVEANEGAPSAVVAEARTKLSLLRSRTQPVGEPVSVRYRRMKRAIWHYRERTDEAMMRAIHDTLPDEGGEIEFLYASPQPAPVDVAPSLDEEWEAVRPMLAEAQIDAIVEEMVGKFSLFVPADVFATEARLILRRALGTQKGGEPNEDDGVRQMRRQAMELELAGGLLEIEYDSRKANGNPPRSGWMDAAHFLAKAAVEMRETAATNAAVIARESSPASDTRP